LLRRIITSAYWKKILDAAHIMSFRLVSLSVETRFLLRKEIYWLWDKYDLSTDPKAWIKNLSKDTFNNYDQYKQYHLTKVNEKFIIVIMCTFSSLLILKSDLNSN
jgi:hypothetical protein